MHETMALLRPPALVARTEVVVAATPSFEDFFRQHYERMVRVAYLMTGARDAAEEVVQDSFARVELRWTKIDAPGSYLRRSVVDRSRKLQRFGRRRHQPADELAAALANLPTKRRAAVVLRYYDGLGDDEIADVLGVRPGTVRSMLDRAMAQLREVIER